MIIEYENDDFLIIDKPAGLPVYSAKSHQDEDSVLSWLRSTGYDLRGVGEADRPGIVHRLDKQTSGLLVLAKTQAGYDFLTKLFRSRDIAKEYLALVYGEMPKHGVIDKPLTKIGHEGQSRVRVDEKGKPSTTEYWAIKHFTLPQPLPSREGNSSLLRGEDKGGGVDEYTLVKIKLHTGRTHQIRVHMASEKHPVMGDSLYGKPDSQKLSAILPRQFLHASRLEFKLPDGTWLEVESKLPEDLQKVLDKLQ